MKNVLDKKRIAKALEMVVGQNKSPADVSRKMKISMPGVCRWMTKYWFYQKPINPVVITLKSDV